MIAAEEARMAPIEPVEPAAEREKPEQLLTAQPKPKRVRRKKKNEAGSAGEGPRAGGD
jgi:hypothetical protein